MITTAAGADPPSMTPSVLMCRSWSGRGSCTHVTPMPLVTLGVTRTLIMLEHFYWWVGMKACTKWWVRRCLKCQARKTSRQTIRWSTLPIPLPDSPGISVSVYYSGPLPITARGNSYILLFTDRFSWRADMFAVTATESTAEGTANTLVNRFISLWECPSTFLSDNRLQFCAQLATAVYKFLGVHKLTTSAYER